MLGLNSVDYGKGNECDGPWSEGTRMKCDHWNWSCNKRGDEIECHAVMQTNNRISTWTKTQNSLDRYLSTTKSTQNK